jgi:hypothetical protein
MSFGTMLAIRYQKQMAVMGEKGDRESDLLCGDSIVNYKTVQSFGHEQLIYDMYERILIPNL